MSSALPRIPVAAPALIGRERDYVLECLDSSWISSSGRFIGDFEQAFADYCGARHAITVNNGTTALHLALAGLGIGPGDEVVIPDLTYIATANAACTWVPCSIWRPARSSAGRCATKCGPNCRLPCS